jgi:hypothetical protein
MAADLTQKWHLLAQYKSLSGKDKAPFRAAHNMTQATISYYFRKFERTGPPEDAKALVPTVTLQAAAPPAYAPAEPAPLTAEELIEAMQVRQDLMGEMLSTMRSIARARRQS